LSRKEEKEGQFVRLDIYIFLMEIDDGEKYQSEIHWPL
jgi:hypothetical protein